MAYSPLYHKFQTIPDLWTGQLAKEHVNTLVFAQETERRELGRTDLGRIAGGRSVALMAPERPPKLRDINCKLDVASL